MFIDHAIVKVTAGTGGSGAMLLRPVQVPAQGWA
jgi:GTPase involved in cell partitioning and DNA repair